MNTKLCASNTRQYDCSGFTGAVDRNKGGGIVVPAADKLVFERQGEFARELLCCMFETGAMADLEVIIDDSCSIRSHIEVLVNVSGYFRTLLRGKIQFQLILDFYL